MDEGPRPDPGPAPPGPGIPAWFQAGLQGLLVVALSYSVVGLSAAMLGVFRPLPVTIVTVAGSVIVLRATRRRPSATRSTSRGDHLVAALVVAGALAGAAWNVAHHAEHLVVDRDPGVYLTTARWLSEHGDLDFDGPTGPFLDRPDLRVNGPGFSPLPDGDFAPQFPHLFPVVMAGAGWISTDLLVLVNPIIGAAAVLCVFAAACTLMRPLAAACAAGLLTLSFPYLHMVRDAYSEPLAMVLLFGGIWLLTRDRRPTPALGAVAGGLLGATCMVRIDGLVSLIPLAAVLGALARQSLGDTDRERLWWVLWAGLGMGATATLGVLETRWFSPGYYGTDLSPRIGSLMGGIAAAAIASFVLSPLLWRRADGDLAPSALLQRTALVGGAALLGVLGWMATVRPDPGGIPELAQDASGPVLGLVDQLATLTYRWQEWYLGRPGAALAFVALVALTASTARAARSPLALALPGVVLATTMLYLWSPSITPDHPWAMRRFLAVSIPGLLVAVGWLIDRAAAWRPTRRLAVGPGIAAAVLLVTALGIGRTTRPLRSVQIGAGSLALVEAACEQIEQEPTAVLVAADGLLSLTMLQTVQAWCGVPVAGVAGPLSADAVIALAREWAAQDRRLVVLSANPTPFGGELGASQVSLPPIQLWAPEVTLTRPPRLLVPDDRIVKAPHAILELHLLEVEPTSSGSAQPPGGSTGS